MHKLIDNKKGSVMELLMIVVMVVIVAGGVYVFSNAKQKTGNPSITPTNAPVSSTELSPTPLPTTEVLPTDTGDTEIDSVSTDLNSMLGDINSLDSVDDDLSLPQLDFSVNF